MKTKLFFAVSVFFVFANLGITEEINSVTQILKYPSHMLQKPARWGWIENIFNIDPGIKISWVREDKKCIRVQTNIPDQKKLRYAITTVVNPKNFDPRELEYQEYSTNVKREKKYIPDTGETLTKLPWETFGPRVYFGSTIVIEIAQGKRYVSLTPKKIERWTPKGPGIPNLEIEWDAYEKGCSYMPAWGKLVSTKTLTVIKPSASVAKKPVPPVLVKN